VIGRLIAFLSRHFRTFAVVSSAAGLALVLWTQRGALDTYPWRLSWPLFLVGVLAFAIGPLAGATSFWLIQRGVGGVAPFAAAVRLWMRSFLARYVPLGALTVVVRVRGRERVAASRAQVLSATAYEQLVAIFAGAFIAAVALALSGRGLALLPAALVAAVLLLAVGGPLAAPRLRGIPWPRRLRLEPVRPGALALAALVCCAGWLATGTAVWTLLRALSPAAPGLLYATGAYALAWLIGFVVPFAPSGLGAREGALIGMLAPRFGVGPAAAIAVLLRFVNIVGDLIAAGLVELGSLLASRRTARLATDASLRPGPRATRASPS
jgi:glycosyltransferase 2 family protein